MSIVPWTGQPDKLSFRESGNCIKQMLLVWRSKQMTLNYMEVQSNWPWALLACFVINVTGKRPSTNSATDQIQNYVLSGIIGGVIYNSSISILSMQWFWWCGRFWSWPQVAPITMFVCETLIDGKPTLLIKNGQLGPEACRSVGLSAADVALKLRSQEHFQMKQD